MAEAEASEARRQPAVLYAFVAQGKDVLAECTEYAAGFTAFVAKSVHPASDLTCTIEAHTFRYIVEGDITFCVVASESTSQDILNAFLEKVKHKFKEMCIGGKVNVDVDVSFGPEFRSKLKEHILYCIDNSHETGIEGLQGVMPEKIDNDLRKRLELERSQMELNKDLKQREEAAERAGIATGKNWPLPAYVENVFEKYNNMWLEEFTSVRSKFESSMREIHLRNISALKTELMAALTAGTAGTGSKRFVLDEGGKDPCQTTVMSLKKTTQASQTTVLSPRKATKARHSKNICAVQNVAIIYDDRMLEHQPPNQEYEEKPERLLKIKDRLVQEGLWERCRIFDCDEVDIESLEAVHTPAHVSGVKKFVPVNTDMYSSTGTTKAAFLAAGGVLKAAELVAKREVEASFAIVRPPGHHVGIDGPPQGFCFFNNVSVAAAHLLNKHGIKKVLVLDWDIHHGDGSQDIFYGDNRVLFFSIHRADRNFYPKSSKKGLDNLGEGSGLGYNINIGWRHNRIRDVDYHSVWDHLLLPITKEFEPQIILISCGFDAAKGDNLGRCDVTPNGFAALLKKLKPLAPVVLALEGGYNVVAIAQSAAACVKVLLGDKSENIRDRALPYTTTRSLIVEAREKLSPYWNCMATVMTEDVMANTISAPRTAEPELP